MREEADVHEVLDGKGDQADPGLLGIVSPGEAGSHLVESSKVVPGDEPLLVDITDKLDLTEGEVDAIINVESGDPGCITCASRAWVQDQEKAAKKGGLKLPKVLDKKTSTLCRHEGANYSLQCLDCALEGVRSMYWGETGTSDWTNDGRPLQHQQVCGVGDPQDPHAISDRGR